MTVISAHQIHFKRIADKRKQVCIVKKKKKGEGGKVAVGSKNCVRWNDKITQQVWGGGGVGDIYKSSLNIPNFSTIAFLGD